MPLSPADDSFAAQLAAALPADTLRQAEPRYLEEPRGRWTGQSRWVALPRTTDEVAQIVRACNTDRVGIVPYGGGTGLVGGQIAPNGPAPLVLSLERMAQIRAVYPRENVLVAEAGAILAAVQSAATQAGALFPLSLASEGSARIGGLLGTNAGGLNVLRYGNARDLVLGIEAVFPNGDILHGLKRLRKDNTGYDLRNLLIGAEGTLGVITAAALRMFPCPTANCTAMMAVSNPAAALDLLALARDRMGETISAFELIDGTGLRFLAETVPDIRQPFSSPPDWSVLIEIGTTQGQNPQAQIETLFEDGMARGLVQDGLIAQSETQAQQLWSVRENIPLANKRIGAIVSHDVSLPLDALPAFIARGKLALAHMDHVRINAFGHLGDGNLHFNVFPPEGRNKAEFADQQTDIQRRIHDLVHEMDGSFSAEHGVGRLKADDLQRYGDPTKLAAMRAIKSALDPNGIMNPGAVLA